ncbi:hypothetical protein HYPSUDRAFT_893113 [Hypholoma sublateritium FD-334 SS-4]|uniref:TLDc domain-containing protein n=1 Tax=Hypholoma sublateritium (strain FD-334 SS-4) TaxID=945553 RepID=A0A0D2NS91_HYPSF|nr:hypothetical protein HYPSUDRAFT_893113 [Hypholoma sublateritium FD-334 SS-4]
MRNLVSCFLFSFHDVVTTFTTSTTSLPSGIHFTDYFFAFCSTHLLSAYHAHCCLVLDDSTRFIILVSNKKSYLGGQSLTFMFGNVDSLFRPSEGPPSTIFLLAIRWHSFWISDRPLQRPQSDSKRTSEWSPLYLSALFPFRV